jgi:hypothetical protein
VGSAQREYERRHAVRERRVREKHPKIGGFVLAVTDDPQSTKAWAQGAEGEASTGRWLGALGNTGAAAVLHDRRLPRSRANIDHLAVTPTAVFVIDSKRYRGRVEQRGTGSLFKPGPPALFVNGRDRTALAAGVVRQVEAVRAALAGHGHEEVQVVGALLFTEGDFSLFAKPFTINAVEVHWPRSLAKRLRQAGEARHDPTAVTTSLAAVFPPA